MAEIEPAELASLLDYAERPRVSGWSLRAALTRYAQPQPQRASDLIEVMRRAEFGLRPHLKDIERNGAAYWDALPPLATVPEAVDATAVGLLEVIASIDRLSDTIAAWAVNREGDRPDAAIDAMVAAATSRLDELGIPHEERPRPSGVGERGPGRRRG